MKWFSCDADRCLTLHGTAEEAKEAAEAALEGCRDKAGGETGWPEDTEHICWGEVREAAERRVIHAHDGDCRDAEGRLDCDYADWDEFWEYDLTPPADNDNGAEGREGGTMTMERVLRQVVDGLNESLEYERERVSNGLLLQRTLRARAERAEARLQQLLENGFPTWTVKGKPESQWVEEKAYLAIGHVFDVAEDRFNGPRRRYLLEARESLEALYGRMRASEIEAAGLRDEVARLRADTARNPPRTLPG